MLGSVPAPNARSKKKSNCLVHFKPTAAQKCSLSVSCGAAAFSKLQGFRVNGISQSQTSPATFFEADTADTADTRATHPTSFNYELRKGLLWWKQVCINISMFI